MLRARDFHKKEAAIKTLRRKAEERNPDEFYFAMEHARTKGGVHVSSSDTRNKYTNEQIRLMKTQDVGYLMHKSQAERSKVERLQQNLHLVGQPAPERKHIVFVDDEKELEKFDPAAHFDTPADLLDRAFNRPRNEQLLKPIVVSSTGSESLEKTLQKAEKLRKLAYDELEKRKSRESSLKAVADHLEMQKMTMSAGRRVKLKDAPSSKPVYRWKAERKR